MIELVSIEDSTGAAKELVVPRKGDVIEWKLNSLRPDIRRATYLRCECSEGVFEFEAHDGAFYVWGRLASIVSINGQKVGTR